jgi:dynein heavy chain
MWSAYRNPKATHNLMIQNRIEIFEKLNSYLELLQKNVDQYLETRRLEFPRFFFMSDSQFLEFLTLAHSNQDFNDLIPILFPGAAKLFVNRIVKQTKYDLEAPEGGN